MIQAIETKYKGYRFRSRLEVKKIVESLFSVCKSARFEHGEKGALK